MGTWWTIWGRRAAIIAACVLVAPPVLLALCLYTPPGHAVVARLIGSLSDGAVIVRGLSGDLPDHIVAQHIELRDQHGAWLTAENVRLDWDALSALGDRLRIDRIEAGNVTVLRRDQTPASQTPSTTVVHIDAIALPQVVLGTPVLGHQARLSANGSLTYASRHDLAANLAIRRLDAVGRYDIRLRIDKDIVQGSVEADEGGQGLLGGLASLPDLGPATLSLKADAEGSSNTLRFSLTAGLLDIFGGGTIDLAGEDADIRFSLVAPTMQPAKDIAWTSLFARGRVLGRFRRPDIQAEVKVSGLDLGSVRVASATASVNGAGGTVKLSALAAGVASPGDKGAFAKAPLRLEAETNLAAPDHTVRFVLSHPLAKAEGRVALHPEITGTVTLDVPVLAALKPLTGVDVDGSASFRAEYQREAASSEIRFDGHFQTRGQTFAARVLGKAKLSAIVAIGKETQVQATFDAAAAHGELHGTRAKDRQTFAASIAITDLSRLVSTIEGTLDLKASLTGSPSNGKLTLEGTALAGTKGMPRQGVALKADASGLPDLKTAHIRASGRFDGSPVTVKADIAAAGQGAWNVSVDDAAWRSAHAQGAFTLAKGAPQGEASVRIARLADLSALLGTPLSGSVDARGTLRDGMAAVRASLQTISVAGAQIARADIDGTVANVFETPVLGLSLTVPGFSYAETTGSLQARLSGALSALGIGVRSSLTLPDGQPLNITANASLDTASKRLSVSLLETSWHGRHITLASPAHLDFSNGLSFAASFIDGKAMNLALNGTLAPKGGVLVHVDGSADLGVMLIGLASSGQNVRGRISVNGTVSGTTEKPVLSGALEMSGGQIQDYTRGVNLTDITAAAEIRNNILHVTSFTAKAAPGTVTGSGTVDLGAAGMPVALQFKASNARPVVSDLLTANMDSEMKLDGTIRDGLRLSGTLKVRQGNINIPEKFASTIATLNVRRTRNAPQPQATSQTHVALDLALSSPGRIFVRGRGLEAEFAGSLKISGTADAPQVIGALTMRRGTFSLPGANLQFSSGTITFNGQSVQRRLDPALDLVATSESGGITATLKIAGTAAHPRIELTSSPSLPQDEILAQLLYQQSAKSLSAVQLASLAQAATALGGGPSLDPVGAVRKGLGLDRLAVGSSQSSTTGESSATVEVGKYVLRNVYIGAKQDFSGGTKAQVQVDITRSLKAQAQVNTGPRTATTNSSPLQDNGDSIGLSYQFEY